MTAQSDPQFLDDLLDCLRLARGLQAGGYYNAAKLLWATAFSLEIQASSAGLPTSEEEMAAQVEALATRLDRRGQPPALLNALQACRRAVLDRGLIAAQDAPPVFVCRSCGQIQVSASPQACPSCSADPLTLRQFLPAYYLEPIEPGEALTALESTPALLQAMAGGLSEAQLQRSGPGNWSLAEAFRHLLVSQQLLQERVQKLLSEEEDPILPGLAAWVLEENDPDTARQTLEKFAQARDATLALLRPLAWHDWQRTGRHQEFGRVTLLQQAGYFARHERDHFRQMAAIRAAVADNKE